MSSLSKIPLDKLEKIHYTQLKVIEERKKSGATAGIQIQVKGFKESFDELTGLLKDIFNNAGPARSEDMLGLHYYIAVIQKIPMARLEALEIETAREIKKRKELMRQRLDAGNIEKAVKGAFAK